jgi:hypothetical protein
MIHYLITLKNTTVADYLIFAIMPSLLGQYSPHNIVLKHSEPRFFFHIDNAITSRDTEEAGLEVML